MILCLFNRLTINTYTHYNSLTLIYLVDPASSHMLVLKIKPCMPKYRWIKNRNCGWLIKSVIINLVMTIEG